ncbi:hypothetical protein FPCIR_11439 [Fusarium pseudocircinatum]|uniref:F-box domain-containing protein n=1 Tax=Fusarium pseudocircinatum TaxID=56676 RepID=A0A8H5KRU4_9HYPO|nr:hypothetical protein FPCIR_11439 [Fusarium pseudocircinatum]
MESCHILRLPDEIHVAVAELLPGNAIKSLRATCTKLNTVASPYLYPVLYLSCHQLDLDVFRLVTSNPLLIGGVKELVIDDTTLSPRLADWEVYRTMASYPHMWPDRKKSYRWPEKFDEAGRVWSDEPNKEFHNLFKSVLRGHHENRQSHADLVALKQALPSFKSLRSLVISNRTADDCWEFDSGAQSKESSSPVVKMWRRLGSAKRERPPFPPRCDWIAPWHEPGSRTEAMQFDFFNDELEKYIKDYGVPPTADEQEKRDRADTQSTEIRHYINLASQFFFSTVTSRHSFQNSSLLASMPQLEDLLLEPHGMKIFSAIPDDVTFRRLQRVEFSCGEIDPQKLVGFIQRHASTLRFLTVQYCFIDPDIFGEIWEHVMRDIRRMQDAKALDLYDGLVAGVYEHAHCKGCGKNNTLDLGGIGLVRHWEFMFLSFWRQYHEYPWDLQSDDEDNVGDDDEDGGSEDGGNEDGGNETSGL